MTIMKKNKVTVIVFIIIFLISSMVVFAETQQQKFSTDRTEAVATLYVDFNLVSKDKATGTTDETTKTNKKMAVRLEVYDGNKMVDFNYNQADDKAETKLEYKGASTFWSRHSSNTKDYLTELVGIDYGMTKSNNLLKGKDYEF